MCRVLAFTRTIGALFTVALVMGACSASDSTQSGDLLQSAIKAMQQADSYHVTVSALSPKAGDQGRVEIDFASPNRFHALVYSPDLSHEQIWANRIHIRDCDHGNCQPWTSLARTTVPASTALADEVAGFPALPSLALRYSTSAEVSNSIDTLTISGDFDLISALGGNPSSCSAVVIGPLGPSSAPTQCVETPAPTVTAKPHFVVSLDPATLRMLQADIYGDELGDLRYVYSQYGKVTVEEPAG